MSQGVTLRRKAEDQTPLKIIELLALHKEYPQYGMKKQTGLSYRTILRHLKPLEKRGYIKLIRREPCKKGGKESKIYALTAKGLLNYFAYATNPWQKLETIITNFPDMCLTFKKWHLFKKAGLDRDMLDRLKFSIQSNLFTFKLVYMDLPIKSPTEPAHIESMMKQIDRNVLVTDMVFTQNKALAKICRSDAELKRFVDTQLSSDIEDTEKYMQRLQGWQAWWNTQSGS